MPVFEYQCQDCKKQYEVYHKVREISEDNRCPACGSPRHKKLMSASVVSMGPSASSTRPEACEGCCNGSCEMN